MSGRLGLPSFRFLTTLTLVRFLSRIIRESINPGHKRNDLVASFPLQAQTAKL